MHIDQLDTPAVIIDLDKLDANITRLQNYLDEHGIANRPHIKTHKIPEIAHMQVRAGAVGITCQKIGEVEVMTRAGIRDIFLPYNILGAAKLERLLHLAQRTTLSVTADIAVTIEGYAATFSDRGSELPVLVEFDCGSGRCGVQTPQEAADLAGLIARSDGLRFDGLMTYPYTDVADAFVQETRRLLAQDGLPVNRVSAGGTPRMWHIHEHQSRRNTGRALTSTAIARPSAPARCRWTNAPCASSRRWSAAPLRIGPSSTAAARPSPAIRWALTTTAM